MKTSCVSGWSAPQVAIFNTCAGVHHRFIHRAGILSGSEPTGQPLAGQGFGEGQGANDVAGRPARGSARSLRYPASPARRNRRGRPRRRDAIATARQAAGTAAILRHSVRGPSRSQPGLVGGGPRYDRPAAAPKPAPFGSSHGRIPRKLSVQRRSNPVGATIEQLLPQTCISCTLSRHGRPYVRWPDGPMVEHRIRGHDPGLGMVSTGSTEASSVTSPLARAAFGRRPQPPAAELLALVAEAAGSKG